MNDFLKMDIFFFTATVVVVVIGILIALILFRIWRILGSAERIANMAEAETSQIREDISEMRRSVKSNGFQWKFVIRFIKRMFGGR